MKIKILTVIISIVFFSFAQTKDAYDSEYEKGAGLFDPSRLTIQHSLSFGMASTSGISNMKSLSQYTTSLQYQFIAPVTLNLNFSLPIHSTFSSVNNMSVSNIQSLEYFKNIPFDVSLTWKPSENVNFSINVARYTEGSYFADGFYPFTTGYYSHRLNRR
ncbi:MAG: hypothetical protein GX640_19870 [Fibrobacter sp.]|nr:hypothetical protein [Fibrobacter sp.]